MTDREANILKSLKSTNLLVAECMASHPYIRGIETELFVAEIRKIRPDCKVSFDRITRCRRFLQNEMGMFVANGKGVEWREPAKELNKKVHRDPLQSCLPL